MLVIFAIIAESLKKRAAFIGFRPDAAASRAGGRRACWGGLLLCWLTGAGAVEEPFARGLLFAIEEPDAVPCYLFGTIHSEDPRVLELPSEVRDAFEESEFFLPEAVPDAQALIRSMIAMVYTDGRTLAEVIGPALYAEALVALAERGLSEAAVKDFKPWAAATLLSVPSGVTGDFLDMHLYKTAQAAGKRITGLESIEEQIAVFEAFRESEQIALLRETLEARARLPLFFEQVIRRWLDRDLAGLLRLSDDYLRGGDPYLAQRFREEALDVRNQRMAQRMTPYLRAGNCFIAVGALHLPGMGGILERLQDQGFALRPIY